MHGYPQGGEGGLTSTVEDLLTWSRHFDDPTLGKTIPTQLAAVAPLTGGHVNRYRRGVAVGELRGLDTIGHGGLWPGYRTELLRLPKVGLTVVVIANLATINPWRLAHAIAAYALEGNKRMKPTLEPVTQAEIKPIAGTSVFNAAEPGLFHLAWINNEPTVTQNGMPTALGRRDGGWFGAEAGSLEFALKPDKNGLKVDLGAGRTPAFKKLGKRKAVPAGLVGIYQSADSGATWTVRKDRRAGTVADVSGPLIASGPEWKIEGIDADTIEIVSPPAWITATQLAHLIRDKAGKIVALEVSTGRIKKMRFERTALREVAFPSRSPLAGVPQEVHSGVDRLDADGTARLSDQESTTIHRDPGRLKKTPSLERATPAALEKHERPLRGAVR